MNKTTVVVSIALVFLLCIVAISVYFYFEYEDQVVLEKTIKTKILDIRHSSRGILFSARETYQLMFDDGKWIVVEGGYLVEFLEIGLTYELILGKRRRGGNWILIETRLERA